MACNLKSVKELEYIVQAKIDKELHEGRMVGPFGTLPIPISPLGMVPKKALGEYRLIHHLFYPQKDSVNDGIPDELAMLHYSSFDSAIQMLASCGQAVLMGKYDKKLAFHLLPMHPENFDLLEFTFDGQLYVDMALSMGWMISCTAYERFSTFFEWVFQQ